MAGIPPECAGLVCPGKSPQTPTPGWIYSPYVKVVFKKGQITVGNKSAPGVPDQFNSAVINNFEYSFDPKSHGWNMQIEILDYGGEMMSLIISSLTTTHALSTDDAKFFYVDFGWIITKEDNSQVLRTVKTLWGKVIHGVPMNIETVHEGGNVKIRFKVTAPTLVNITHDLAFGTEKQKMPLRQALTELFTKVEPRVDQIEFKDKSGNNSFAWLESDGGYDGPKGVWVMNQLDKMNTARMWMSPYLTKHKKAVLMIYDASGGEGAAATKIIIQEDPDYECCGRNLATFIINGGNDSPVISFNPTIGWLQATGQGPGGGGTMQGSAQAGANKLERANPPNQYQKQATQTSVALSENLWRTTPPGVMIPKTNAAIEELTQMAIRNGLGVRAPFEADLKIWGDPFWCDPFATDGQGAGLYAGTFSILYINPFMAKDVTIENIQGETTGKKPGMEWLAKPKCNEYLSNKSYTILGVTHQIQGGQYVTTFKLKVLIPNIDLPANTPIGKCGSSIDALNQNANNVPVKPTEQKD